MNNPQAGFHAGVGGPLTVVGNRIIFRSREPQNQQDRLFATDGTSLVQLAGGIFGQQNNGLSDAVNAGSVAIFEQASLDQNLRGLWATDGTPAGTHRISADAMGVLHAINGRAHIVPQQSGGDYYVWSSDGTAEGTGKVRFLELPDQHGWVITYVNIEPGQDRVAVQVPMPNGIPQLWSLDPHVPTGSVTGTSFYDINRDGKRQGFEPPLNGTAYIDMNDNDVYDQGDIGQPSANGAPYLIEWLPPAHYSLRFDSTSTITLPAGGEYSFDLAPWQKILNANFTAVDDSTVVWGMIFKDENKNGVQDGDEGPMVNQTVYADVNGNDLFDPGIDPTMQTANDGTYGLVVPGGGTYEIRRPLVPGWRQTSPAGRDGFVVSVATGQAAQAPAFGVSLASPGRIHGGVMYDWDRNGTYNDGDTPGAGAPIYLDLNNDGIRSSQEPQVTANSSGGFDFMNLVPDTYTVRWNSAGESGPVQTFPAPGQGFVAVVPEDQSAFLPNFLIYSLPAGQIRGIVWSDRNSNGRIDAGEPPVRNTWTVWIDLDNDGVIDGDEPLTHTNGAGAYSFTRLAAGSYVLRQVLPAGWSQSAPAGDSMNVDLVDGQQVSNANFGAHSQDVTGPIVQSAGYDPNSNKLSLTFDEDVVIFASTKMRLDNLQTAGADLPQATLLNYNSTTHTAVFWFTRIATPTLPDGNWVATLAASDVSDSPGNPMAADYKLNFFILAGDVDRDRQVTINDFITLSSNFGKTNASYRDGDLNYDRQVTIADFIDLSANFNKVLSPPTPPPQPASEIVISSSSSITSGVLKSKPKLVISRSARHHRKPYHR